MDPSTRNPAYYALTRNYNMHLKLDTILPVQGNLRDFSGLPNCPSPRSFPSRGSVILSALCEKRSDASGPSFKHKKIRCQTTFSQVVELAREKRSLAPYSWNYFKNIPMSSNASSTLPKIGSSLRCSRSAERTFSFSSWR